MKRFHGAARIVGALLILFGATALAAPVAQYRGANYKGLTAEATVTFGDDRSFYLEMTIATEGAYSFSGTVNGAQAEGDYHAPSGFGGGYFKAVFSGAPNGNAVPNQITLYHTEKLLWPTTLNLIPPGPGNGNGNGNGNGGANGGGNGNEGEDNPQLETMWVCDPQPLVITISQLPSRGCTLWIGNWRRNSAALVQVIMPQAIDGYGNHPNGIQVFGANQPGTGQGVAGFAMGGYSGPGGTYGKWYPWNLLIFACPAPPGAGTNCFGSVTTPGQFQVPLIVRQDGARDANVLLVGTALPSPYGQTGGLAGATFFRIRNQWQPAQYLNIEAGFVQASPVQPNWLSSQWFFEQVPGTPFVRIGNRWKPGEYLNIEHGLASSPAPAQWWSAMWTIEPVENTNGIYRIRNRWRNDHFLHIQNGRLECTTARYEWWSAMWVLER